MVERWELSAEEVAEIKEGDADLPEGFGWRSKGEPCSGGGLRGGLDSPASGVGGARRGGLMEAKTIQLADGQELQVEFKPVDNGDRILARASAHGVEEGLEVARLLLTFCPADAYLWRIEVQKPPSGSRGTTVTVTYQIAGRAPPRRKSVVAGSGGVCRSGPGEIGGRI